MPATSGIGDMTSVDTLAASVVVPYGGGPRVELMQQLKALAGQHAVGRLEVIVVDNTQDGRLLKHMCGPEGGGLEVGDVQIRVVWAGEVPGPSFARNAGWRVASYDHVLFCDADDVVDRRWAAEMLKKLRLYDLVGGRLEYAHLNGEPAARWNRQSTTELPRKFDYLHFAASCSLGVHKRVLDRIDGFSTSLRYGEDIDLSWRAQQAGFTIGFASDAVTHYRLRSGIAAMWRQALSYGRSDGTLLARHRSAGARRRVAATVLETAAVAWSWVSVLRGANYLPKAVWRTGNLVGRLLASVQLRSWCL
jgi:GT2 family glycosyltransferase